MKVDNRYAPPKGGKYPYDKVHPLAVEVLQRLKDHCILISLAGSLRRGEKYVGDIEIVCVPESTSQETLFGEKESTGRSDSFIKIARDLGQKVRGGVAGRYTRRELRKGVFLDLFMTTREDFYRQLAIRTGPAIYSRLVIATAWRKKGWVGTPDGLRKMEDCFHERSEKNNGKQRWRCVDKNPTLPPAWNSEVEFYEWLGLQYVPPQSRGKQ